MIARVLRVNRNQLALGAHNKRRGVSVIKDPYGANVSLLLPFDGFVDISRSPKTITADGNANTTTAKAVFNGSCSGYFDGTNSRLSIAHDTNLSFGTITAATNFSIEFWIYPTGTMSGSSSYWLFSKGMPGSGGSGVSGWGVRIYGGCVSLMVGATTATYAAYIATSATLTANVWTHVAIICISGAPYFYFNGVPQIYTYTYGTTLLNSNTTNAAYALEIGCSQIDSGNPSRSNWFFGYLYGIRITPGIARDVAYKVPTRPYPDPRL